MATVKQTKTITGSTSSSTWTWKQVITESWADDYLTTNKSIVKVETFMGRATNSSTASFGGTATTKIICDGITRSKSQSWNYQSFWISGGGWKLIQTEEFPVEHEADGTKTITVSSSLSTSDFNPNSASANGSITLTTIPRTTDCPNIDGYIEGSANIVLNPASTTFKHRLYYEYGKKTGYYPSSSTFFANTGALPLDSSFYNETPKSSGTGKITLYTYTSDGTQIGSSSGEITVRCDKDKCAPMIAMGIRDINTATTALTTNDTYLVKGYSTAELTYLMTPLNGASITSKTVNGAELSTSPHKIYNVSTGSFKITVIDSRGFDTTNTFTNRMVDYVPLTLSFEAYRPTPTGSEIRVRFEGDYFNSSFGKVANTLSLSWKYRVKGVSSWTDGGTFTKDTHYTISGNRFVNKGDYVSLSTSLFTYTNNYEIAIYYNDKLINTSTAKTVPKGQPVIYWEDGKVGVNGTFNASGATSVASLSSSGAVSGTNITGSGTVKGATINATSTLQVGGSNILERIYPVGSIYMSTQNKNPKDLFSFGTWEQIQGKFLFAANSTRTAGSTGGAETVALTVNQLPKHGHPQNYAPQGADTNRMVTSSPEKGMCSDDNIHGSSAGTKAGSQYAWSSSSLTIVGTGRVGNNEAHENMPPYLAVYMWKRTA